MANEVEKSAELLLQHMLMNAPDPNEPLPLSNQPKTLYGTTVTFLVLSFLFVGTRLWVRFRVMHEPGWDDFLVVLAALLNTAATIILLISIRYGLGHHYLYIGLENMSGYQKHFWAMNAIYITETAVIKMSLLLQYLRIFKAGTMRWICLGLLAIVTAWGITYGFIAWFPCFPVSAYWNRTRYPNATCYGFGFDFTRPGDFIGLFTSHTALNMVFDVSIFLTPMVLFSTPKLKRENIISLAGIFIIGSIVVMISIWRLHSIVTHKAATVPYIDFTWWAPPAVILSCLEIDLAIMVASMPVFWPVVESSFAAIFVTHEVQITEHRRLDDEEELYEMESGKGVRREGSLKSEGGNSREGLNRLPSMEDGKTTAVVTRKASFTDHYRDPYNIAQVDPFGAEANAGISGVATNVDSTAEKPKWRM